MQQLWVPFPSLPSPAHINGGDGVLSPFPKPCLLCILIQSSQQTYHLYRVCVITPLHRRSDRGQGCSVTRSRCLSPLPPGLRASSLAHKAGLLVFFPSQRQLQRAGDRPPPTPELILCCLPGGPGLNPRGWGLEEEASGGGMGLGGRRSQLPTLFCTPPPLPILLK